MKKLNIPFIGILLLFLAFTSCEYDGIDPITAVDPGPDGSDPQVTVLFPTEGSRIQDLDLVSTIVIKMEVVDDIEVASISVSIDGTEIANLNEFLDYRIVKQQLTYDNITAGDHVLTVTATDIVGNSTISTINFSKAPPYSPLFAGEIFYMPFDDNFIELVSVTPAAEVGTPGFAGDAYVGTNAYKGTTDSYLTFPADQTLGNEFTAAFWYKLNTIPDRAGILTMGPPDVDNPGFPEIQNKRTSGFRLFRENNNGKQTLKLIVGIGAADIWNDDGGALDLTAGEWVHIAFTISATETIIYYNGMPVSTVALDTPVDWTGCDLLSIMSGAPRFNEWGHLSDSSPMDELRLFNTALSQNEIQNMINAFNPYEPKYEGETLYIPFDGTNAEYVSNRISSVVGSPGFEGDGKIGSDAYKGALDSYLTYPTDGLQQDQFSAAFWYKYNANDLTDNAGLLTMGPPDLDNAGFPEIQNKRTSGFRLFRDGQRMKLNVGTGAGEGWNDGVVIDVAAGEWMHVAFTISATQTIIYLNGVAYPAPLSGPVDWAACDLLSVMSGAPRFTEWGHKSDVGNMDELRFFNKVLTKAEIDIMRAE
ncbi:MAG: Ig-like domain-containing protein [Gillisia sp.]|nr:Ig-like domain-containing protein [Gillisia sp.]